MLLSPHEPERLLVHVVAGLARDRRARGLRLNCPEVVALLTSWVLEGARDGRGVTDLMSAGQHLLPGADGSAGDGGPSVHVVVIGPRGWWA